MWQASLQANGSLSTMLILSLRTLTDAGGAGENVLRTKHAHGGASQVMRVKKPLRQTRWDLSQQQVSCNRQDPLPDPQRLRIRAFRMVPLHAPAPTQF